MTKKDILNQYGYLFWWVKQKDNLSDEAIVETLLCYGDEEQVKSLFSWLGINKVSEIFKKQTKQTRINYPERTQHFFTLLFEKHVHGYFRQIREQLTYYKDVDYSEEVEYMQGFEVTDEQIKTFLTEIALKGFV